MLRIILSITSKSRVQTVCLFVRWNSNNISVWITYHLLFIKRKKNSVLRQSISTSSIVCDVFILTTCVCNIHIYSTYMWCVSEVTDSLMNYQLISESCKTIQNRLCSYEKLYKWLQVRKIFSFCVCFFLPTNELLAEIKLFLDTFNLCCT